MFFLQAISQKRCKMIPLLGCSIPSEQQLPCKDGQHLQYQDEGIWDYCNLTPCEGEHQDDVWDSSFLLFTLWSLSFQV